MESLLAERMNARSGDRIASSHEPALADAVAARRCARLSGSSTRLLTLMVAVLALALAPTRILAGVDFQDISPDISTFYQPTSAFGASAGRVNKLASVAGNSQAYYAASEWGGLFKTEDRGLTWFRLDGHLPVATWDVETDPSNPSRVYATSFFDGREQPLSGIEVSNDAGATWVHPASATPIPGVNAPVGFTCPVDRVDEPAAFGIGIRPDAPQNVFIGTNCGLAISSDSGSTWRFVDPTPGDPADDVWDVIAQAGGPTGQGIVDVCGEAGHWRSTDGGFSWTGGSPDLPRGRCSIAASPDEPDVLFVADDLRPQDPDHHSVWESDDAGGTWTRLGKPYPTAQHKRLPFLVTNKRSDSGGIRRFDLWYAEESLWRVSCTTPSDPASTALRCPPHPDCGAAPCAHPPEWLPPPTGPRGELDEYRGAHGDAGDLVFDPTLAVDACPVLYSSDGGVFYNDPSIPDCQDPSFMQPNRSPHALWLWGMAGANQPGDQVELYFGVQDDGAWATSDAEAVSPTWNDGPTSDSFTMVADTERLVWLSQDGLRLQETTGMVGGIPVNPPTPCLVMFRFIDTLARFGDKQYVVIAARNPNVAGCDAAGVYKTDDITASPVQWVQLGTGPVNACGIRASVSSGPGQEPVFYVQDGSCNANIFDNTGDRLWKYPGSDPGGTWERVDDNDGMTGGIGIFGVDPGNADRLYASNLRSPANGGPHMVFSNDGGATWEDDPDLDQMMTGNGAFKYRTERGATTDTSFFWTFPGYPQPSLVAFDPADSDILLAGGRDSGLFLSTNGGEDWGLLSDPFEPGQSGIPHIPRPWFAHFQHDSAGILQIYLGTQGRGVWRVSVDNQPPVATICSDVSAECAGDLTSVSLDGTCSSDPDGDPLSYLWSSPTCTFVDPTAATPLADCPLGSNPVSLVVSDPLNTKSLPATATVAIVDTIAPELEVSLSPTAIWPPNHHLHTITAEVEVHDICDPNAADTLVSITSNEADNANGDGNTVDDIQGALFGTDDHLFRLRSERSGTGGGRIYTVVYQAHDLSGNTSSSEATVEVRHDQRR